MTRWNITVLIITAVLGWAGMAQAGEAPASNLVDNAGFEDWADYIPSKGTPSAPAYENNLAPAWWSPGAEAEERNKNPNFPLTVTVGQDQTIRHGGNSSIRVRNLQTTDIGFVASPPFAVLPNHTYKYVVWYKAENVVKNAVGGYGVLLTVSQGPTEDFWNHQTFNWVTPKICDGTTDWRRIEIRITTKPTTQRLCLSMQLRRGSGTVWFDDAALIDADSADPAPATDNDGGSPRGGQTRKGVVFSDSFNGLGVHMPASSAVNRIGWFFSSGAGGLPWKTELSGGDRGFSGNTLRNPGGDSTWTWANKQFNPIALKVGDSISVRMNFKMNGDNQFTVGLFNVPARISSDSTGASGSDVLVGTGSASYGYVTCVHPTGTTPIGPTYQRQQAAGKSQGYLTPLYTDTRHTLSVGNGTGGHELTFTLTRTATGVRMEERVDNMVCDSYTDDDKPSYVFNTLGTQAGGDLELDNISVRFDTK